MQLISFLDGSFSSYKVEKVLSMLVLIILGGFATLQTSELLKTKKKALRIT